MKGASLSTCLTLPFLFVPQNRTWSACLLPLLYQTPTLLSKPKTASSFSGPKRHVNCQDRHNRNFSSTTQRQTEVKTALQVDSHGYGSSDAPLDTKPRKKKDTKPPKTKSASKPSSSIKPQKKGKLPFPQKKNQQTQPGKPSTITAAEQTAFDRLIKEVSGPATSEEDGEEILDQEEPISGYDPDIDLDTIFEDAIKLLRLSKEQAAESAARNLANPVWRQRAIDIDVPNERQALAARLFKRPLGTPTGFALENKTLTGSERERLETACDEHRTLVLTQLDGANSDEEIWRVLQEQVFSLVIRLNGDVRKAELADKRGAKKDGEVREARRNKTEEWRARKNLGTTKAIPINEVLLILHRNYAEYCLHTLRLFRRKYPTSLYALHVLTTIKDLGPISYVLGVSTDIYNEFLFLQWTQYSDLHGMAETTAEMHNQGIEGNDVTVALIKGIARQRRRAKRSFAGPVMKEWWYMRGNVEGWRRVEAGYRKITGKPAERAAALGEEVESEDEALVAAGG